MEIEKGKISIRQALIITAVAMTAPITRILPVYTAEIAKKACWVSTIISGILFLLLIFLLNRLFKKYPDYGLDQIFEVAFGKVIGKGLLMIYILWFFLLVGIYVRFFAERFLSSILPYTPMEFFITSILIFALIANKGGIEVFARTVEVLFLVFLISFLFTFLFLISQVNIVNLYPVTIYDGIPIMQAVVPSLGIWSYISFMLFLGDKISHKEMMKKYGTHLIIFLTIFSLMIILGTVGVFGYKLIGRFSLPYFLTLKNIEILNTVERVEAVFISTWIINDFVIITTGIFILKNLLKKFLSLNNENSILTPIILIVYVLAFYVADTKLELEEASSAFGTMVNIVLGVGIPLLALIVGKIRKKI